MKFCTFVILFLIASPVAAHWQYTRWGMTPAQVKAAAPVDLEARAKAEGKTGSWIGLTGNYSAAGHTYQAAFFFSSDHDGLDMVMLEQPTVGECRESLDALREKYGAGDDSGRSSSILFRDTAGGNVIKFTDNSRLDSMLPKRPGAVSVACFISYEPAGVDKGL